MRYSDDEIAEAENVAIEISNRERFAELRVRLQSDVRRWKVSPVAARRGDEVQCCRQSTGNRMHHSRVDNAGNVFASHADDKVIDRVRIHISRGERCAETIAALQSARV